MAEMPEIAKNSTKVGSSRDDGLPGNPDRNSYGRNRIQYGGDPYGPVTLPARALTLWVSASRESGGKRRRSLHSPPGSRGTRIGMAGEKLHQLHPWVSRESNPDRAFALATPIHHSIRDARCPTDPFPSKFGTWIRGIVSEKRMPGEKEKELSEIIMGLEGIEPPAHIHFSSNMTIPGARCPTNPFPSQFKTRTHVFQKLERQGKMVNESPPMGLEGIEPSLRTWTGSKSIVLMCASEGYGKMN
ncbi:hypothetical protein DFH06DRAFT_1136248 [Mycena polygramma]|nr:hypothetical protein DFH06DRAFT_1136248 [Mycena polygramma]